MKAAVVWMLAIWSAVAGELQYKPAPALNPLKGLVAYARSDFPFTLAYGELPLSAFDAGNGWDRLEKWLNAIAKLQRQGIVRVYAHWPGRNEAPDYNDAAVQGAITNFVAEFGKKYDGDARIGFIEVGLLGEWGEWIERKKGTIPESLKVDVLAAYANAFKTTKVLARWPSELTVGKGFGYHDDWFGHTTQFAEKMREFTVGKGEPIGGRIHPRFENCLWDEAKRCGPTDKDFSAAVKANGYTFLRSPGTIEGDRERALKWSRELGYEFYVRRAELGREISVTITNTGVAPFYYRWPVELGLRSSEATFAGDTDWDIREVVSEKTFRHRLPNEVMGKFQAVMRVRNPMTNGLPISFANVEQDSVIEGWLTLGEVILE